MFDTTTERVSYIVYLFTQGRQFRTSEVAGLLQISEEGARKMLLGIARIVPLTQSGGVWSLLDAGRRQNENSLKSGASGRYNSEYDDRRHQRQQAAK